MREAYHVIEQVTERLPYHLTKEHVQSYKQLAKKGIYQCPYCQAELIVKYSDIKEVHFSHRHSEACTESKMADKAEKKYRKQTERETPQHKTLVDIFIDELKSTSKINPTINVDYGYRANINLKQYPDIFLKIGQTELAISIVTNVTPNLDATLAKEIQKRHKYFQQQGMHPIWFIENKELAIEKEKHAIVLWEAEASISLHTSEDKKWETALKTIATDLLFFKPYNYVASLPNLKVEVRSLYYIQSTEDGISVLIHRYLKDRIQKPFRAFLLGEGYKIPFSQALAINEKKLNLSDPQIEESNRNQFIENYHFLHKEQEEAELRRIELEEQQRKELEKQKELLRQQMMEERKKQQLEANENKRAMHYDELKLLLRKRINLTQKEQQELWSKYMLRKIGPKNAQKVWDIVEGNDVRSFEELKRLL
ncbi:competence protein CoiA family protein [Bacillus alkalisoli]|uniref:competence protein CoiA family protein n=1 Tax=Bacillus alkalisoli TaxID=2011008 RepID=UPI000C24E6C2|nr:competence protein CoiA family protein [Bacillus alkalisoli]